MTQRAVHQPPSGAKPMLRISFSAEHPVPTVHLEGKLLAPWLDEVRAVVGRATARGATRVDLDGLTFADQAGIELLQELGARGVAIDGASPFINELLASFTRPIR